MPHHSVKKTTSRPRQSAATHRSLPVWFTLLVCVVMLSLSLGIWLTRPARLAHQNPLPVSFKVDVNHADVMTLAGLPGLGKATGQRIINHRDKHGRFAQPSDLTQVNGIGNAKLLQLQPWIYCGPGVAAAVIADADSNTSSSSSSSSGAQKSGSPAGELPLEESSTLPGDLTR